MLDPLARPVANRESYAIRPSGPMARLPYQAAFSQAEYALIRRGLIPAEMDDKWFIFWEADSLYLHRSWTGHQVYRVEFQPMGSGFEVAQATVTSDATFYHRGPDSDEAALLDFLIRGLLLHQPVEFPLPSSARTSSSAGLYQHHIAGSGFPERRLPRTEATLLSKIRGWLGL